MNDVKIEFRKPMYPVNPDLMDYLDAKGEKEALANMQAYREKYGI